MQRHLSGHSVSLAEIEHCFPGRSVTVKEEPHKAVTIRTGYFKIGNNRKQIRRGGDQAGVCELFVMRDPNHPTGNHQRNS